MKSLAIAATGMNAQQTNVEIIANNIANINTTSYKRSRAEFTDLFYQIDRMQGVPNPRRRSRGTGRGQIGLGVRSAAVRKLHIQGSLAQTGNPYDLAINGRGWFQIAGPNGEDALYPRRLLQHQRQQPARDAATATGRSDDHHSAGNGRGHRQRDRPGVRASWTRKIASRQIGQLNLANFANEAGLDPLGGNLYQETLASGMAVVGRPRRSRLRQDPPALSGGFERRSGQGNHRTDLRPALLRNECQSDPGGGRHGPTISKGLR